MHYAESSTKMSARSQNSWRRMLLKKLTLQCQWKYTWYRLILLWHAFVDVTILKKIQMVNMLDV